MNDQGPGRFVEPGVCPTPTFVDESTVWLSWRNVARSAQRLPCPLGDHLVDALRVDHHGAHFLGALERFE